MKIKVKTPSKLVYGSKTPVAVKVVEDGVVMYCPHINTKRSYGLEECNDCGAWYDEGYDLWESKNV